MISVGEYVPSIYKSFTTNQEGYLELMFEGKIGVRSQDLPTSYFDAGQFYIDMISKSAHKYMMPSCGHHTKIVGAKLGNNAGSLGAAALIFGAQHK